MNRLLAAVALLGMTTIAHANNETTMCVIKASNGETARWTFAPNTYNADGSLGGTMIETSYVGNGKTVVGEVGRRPVWILTVNKVIMLQEQKDPSWFIVMVPYQQGQNTTGATLFHGQRVMGTGACGVRSTAPTAGSVGDVAPE